MKQFQKSEEHLAKAIQLIPTAAQTRSRSYLNFPEHVSPLFCSRAKGGFFWDLDQNRFLDLSNGLASVIIGHCCKKINDAVIHGLSIGNSLSLPTKLELEVAETLQGCIPSAEKIKFGKTGSDANSAAIRLARAYSNKNKVVMCGYHGWADWSVSNTDKDQGVTKETKRNSIHIKYNDLPELSSLITQDADDIAAIILEPMNRYFPAPGYLEGVRELSKKNNIVLIFDEVITGFRFGMGGAQSLFNVTPDLTTLGKGMANGFSISAVVGQRDLMDLFDKVFFSGTFSGEVTGLSAAKATLDFLTKNNVPSHLYKKGAGLKDGLETLINSHHLQNFLSVSGHPSWSFLNFHGEDKISRLVKSEVVKNRFQSGLFCMASHNISFSHKSREIKYAIEAYDQILDTISEGIKSGTLLSKTADINATNNDIR